MRFIYIILFTLLVASTTDGFSQINLISNGGFELGTAGQPTGAEQIEDSNNWKHCLVSSGALAAPTAALGYWFGPNYKFPGSSTTAHLGNYFAGFHHCAGITQGISTLKKGDRIRISFYYRINQINSDIVKSLHPVFSKKRARISDHCSFTKNGPTQSTKEFTFTVNGNTLGWQLYDSGIVTINENGFDWFTIWNEANSTSGKEVTVAGSMIYVDDVAIYRITDCGTPCCPEYELVQNASSNVPSYVATQSYIQAGANVDPDAATGAVTITTAQSVTFQAGNSIILSDGFSVTPGASFKALIASCASAPLNISVSNELRPCSNVLCVNICNPPINNYTISWSHNLGNLPTVEVAPSSPTTYTVSVKNLGTGQITSQSITVTPEYFYTPISLTSSQVSNILTPNGDGYNEAWIITDNGKTSFAYNAYRYELEIYSEAYGKIVYKDSETNVAPGFADGDISWNGRLNGSGVILADGYYVWSLKLFNCANPNGVDYNGILALKTRPFRMGSQNIDEVFETQLLDAYPNPFSASTSIDYSIEKTGPVKVVVTDMYGKIVATLVDTQRHEAGAYSTKFNSLSLPAGVYLYTLETTGYKQTKQIAIIK